MSSSVNKSSNPKAQKSETLKITTERFGEMEFPLDSIITVLGGIIGFPELTRYVLIQRPHDVPFYWLQCIDDPSLALVILNPVLFKPDYQPQMPKGLKEELSAGEEEISLFSIITIPSGQPQKMTANLLGPLVVCPSSRKAKQVILDDRFYTHRQSIISG
jgi:flagellar assembly factor FliW